MASQLISCDEDALQALVRLVYEAALEPAHWKMFLEKFAFAVNGLSTALGVHDFVQNAGSAAESFGLEPHWQKVYAEHYSAKNIWIQKAPHLLLPGFVVQTQEAVTDGDLQKTEFYHDYLRPQNFFYCFGGTFGRAGAVVSFLTAFRSRQAGAFGEPEMAIVRYLMPHFDCALRVHSRLSSLEKRLNASTTVLDRLPWAVMLVDSQCKPILINSAARNIFEQDDGLCLTSRGLLASDHTLTDGLQQAIRTAILLQASGREAAEGAILKVPRPSCRRPYEVLVVPIASDVRLSEVPSAMAAVFVTDPEQQPLTDLDALRKIYGFTQAEARIAVALMLGKTIESAAEEFEISIHTARTHLKRILSKTQTKRQTELIRLLMNSPARLRNVSPR